MGKELLNWQNGRWIGQTLEVENGVCAVPGKPAEGELAYTDEVKAATDHLYAEVSDFIPEFEWPAYAPLVHAINKLKKEKNAVIACISWPKRRKSFVPIRKSLSRPCAQAAP